MYTLTSDPDTVLNQYGTQIDKGSRDWDIYQAWLAGGNTANPVQQPTTEALKAKLAAKRYEVETSGYTFNSIPIHSDDRAQFKAIAEVMRIQQGSRVDGEMWKCADRVFRPFTNGEFLTMFAEGEAHVKKCFAVESACQALIDAGETDIETIWAQEWAK